MRISLPPSQAPSTTSASASGTSMRIKKERLTPLMTSRGSPVACNMSCTLNKWFARWLRIFGSLTTTPTAPANGRRARGNVRSGKLTCTLRPLSEQHFDCLFFERGIHSFARKAGQCGHSPLVRPFCRAQKQG